MQITVQTSGSLRAEATDGRVVTAMDEPPDAGGQGTALSPRQTLLAALGGCTAMTLKLYSARKQWPLEDVRITVRLTEARGGEPARIEQEVELVGPLDADQRARLREIAGRCPVHRLMEGPVAFVETLAVPAGQGG